MNNNDLQFTPLSSIDILTHLFDYFDTMIEQTKDGKLPNRRSTLTKAEQILKNTFVKEYWDKYLELHLKRNKNVQ